MNFLATIKNGSLPDIVGAQISTLLGTLEGHTVEIRILKYFGKATDRQRKYWFGVVIPAFIVECGYEEPGAKDRCHNDLVYELMPEFRKTRVSPITGIVEVIRASWRDFDTAQSTILIERAFVFASTQYSIAIPSPGEYE